ncbi:MAG: hypothetical protein LAT68_11210 [Cyclobacteriaceae bacterium]|nr:hypothetical protein [Cyclobacteriaceae bacterium]MCH8516884.1 hypothetical protein [Cyclobacteriaceae bacterium]
MKLNKRSWTYSLLALAILMVNVSCLEIEEKVKLNNDGSGSYELLIDLSLMEQMISLFENFGDQSDDQTKPDINSEIKEVFSEDEIELQNIAGITNVKLLKKDEKIASGLKFDFKDIEALNQGLSALGNNNSGYTKFFDYKGNQLSRVKALNFEEEMKLDDLQDADGVPESFNMSLLFRDFSYTTTYEFDKEVVSVSNKESMIGADKKKVVLTYYPFREDAKNKSMLNTIELSSK